jgi:DNA-binding NarL/FixJ family response regulator
VPTFRGDGDYDYLANDISSHPAYIRSMKTQISNIDFAPVLSGRALVIDDHPLFCDALELTLRTISQFEGVVTANSLDTALSLVQTVDRLALILLDLNLPDVEGLDGLIRLKRVLPDIPVIIVSSVTDNSIITSAISCGAQGYVPKHSHRSVFLDALSAIAQGEIYKPQGYVEGETRVEKDMRISRLSSLTQQQARILDLICKGKLNKQIAFDLSIAETTVKAHVTAIMRKLGVQSRTQAVLVAQETKLPKLLP